MASEQQVTQLEKRADQAEQSIKQLQTQLQDSKIQGENELNLYKQQLLQQLQTLRNTLVEEQKQINETVQNTTALKEERDILKAENEKLKYRVKILLRSLEEEEKKNQSS